MVNPPRYGTTGHCDSGEILGVGKDHVRRRRALQDARETALAERRDTIVLRRLSAFLADASLALDSSDSLREMLQLVAEHARELPGAQRCAVGLTIDDVTPSIDAFAIDQPDPAFASQIAELSSLYRALNPPTGSLRMTGSELDHHRQAHALTAPDDPAAWKPRGWLASALTALDGRHLGLIQVFDKQAGDFSELGEAILVQLAQMASAAVERAQLYRLRAMDPTAGSSDPGRADPTSTQETGPD